MNDLLFGIGVFSVFYSIVCSLIQEARAKRLAGWVKKHHPEAWQSLPWIIRKIAKEDIGLRRIRKTEAIGDPFFSREYPAVKKLDPHIWLSLLVGSIFFILTALKG